MFFLAVAFAFFSTITVVYGQTLRGHARTDLLTQALPFSFYNGITGLADPPTVFGTFPADPKYASLSLYFDAGCANPVAGASFLIDTCMSTGSTSLKFTCVSGGLTINSFSDNSCANATASQTISGCISFAANTSDFAVGVSFNTCPTDALDLGPGSYAAAVSYEDSRCDANILGAIGIRNGVCIPADDYSFQVSWPYQQLYNNPDCSGAPLVQAPFNQTCHHSNDETPFAFANTTYTQWTEVNFAPLNSVWSTSLFAVSVAVTFLTLF